MYRDFFGDDGGVNEREFWGTDDGGGVPRKGGPPKRRGAQDMEDLEDEPFSVHASQYLDEEDDEDGEEQVRLWIWRLSP